MPITFEGVTYDTISDVTQKYPISVKKLKKLIQEGAIPAPEVITHGTRTFNHYSPAWQVELGKLVKPRNGKA